MPAKNIKLHFTELIFFHKIVLSFICEPRKKRKVNVRSKNTFKLYKTFFFNSHSEMFDLPLLLNITVPFY